MLISIMLFMPITININLPTEGSQVQLSVSWSLGKKKKSTELRLIGAVPWCIE